MESYPYPENTGVGGVDGVGKLDRGLGFTDTHILLEILVASLTLDIGGVSHV
jgi:hypothetical protein